MDNLTVPELKERCKSLNIKLTKSDGSQKLKKDLIKSLSSVNQQLSIVGGRKRRSRKGSKKRVSRRRSRKSSRKSKSSKKKSRRRRSRKQCGGVKSNYTGLPDFIQLIDDIDNQDRSQILSPPKDYKFNLNMNMNLHFDNSLTYRQVMNIPKFFIFNSQDIKNLREIARRDGSVDRFNSTIITIITHHTNYFQGLLHFIYIFEEKYKNEQDKLQKQIEDSKEINDSYLNEQFQNHSKFKDGTYTAVNYKFIQEELTELRLSNTKKEEGEKFSDAKLFLQYYIYYNYYRMLSYLKLLIEGK